MKRRRRARKHKMPMSADSKRGLYVALIWIGAALFAVLVALFIGNALGDAAEKIDQSGGALPLYEYKGGTANAVDAAYFEINGHNESSILAAVGTLKNGSDISVIIKGAGRAPSYRSAVSYAVEGSEGGLFDLASFTGALRSKEVYAVGCFYSDFASASSPLAMSARIEYEASLIAEAAAAGVREIVVFGLPTDKEGIALASELFKKAREKAPNVILGAAVGYRLLESTSNAYVIDTYDKFADFCAIDTSGALRAGTNAASFLSSVLHYFESYPLRVLFEDVGESDRAAQKQALNELGIYDIQSIPFASAG